MTIKLYELSAAYRELADLENEGDFSVALLNLSDEASAKLLSIAKLLREWDAEASALRAETKRLADMAGVIDRRGEWLRQYAEANMTTLGLDNVRDTVSTLRFQNNPPRVEVTDEALVPSNFKRATLKLPLKDVPEDLVAQAVVEIDKRAILELAKSGVDVRGTNIVQTKRLVIK